MEYAKHAVGSMNVPENGVSRNYKDTVFRLLFKEKAAMLDLYNAVNGTKFDNVEDVEITTLENAVYMSMKNDVSFVFAFEMNLYEHQSTVNPNMPLRNLHYISAQLQKIIPNKKLYGSKRVEIPMPRFVVFYNGVQNMPERMEYRLSDLYKKTAVAPELELKVTVLNINSGMNDKLTDGCKLLKEYMIYTEKVRQNMQITTLKNAVEMAVDECIREGVLADFLTKQRAEVIAMSIFEYDQEGHMQLIREEGREVGEVQKGLQILDNLLKRGFSREEALEIVQLSEEQLYHS